MLSLGPTYLRSSYLILTDTLTVLYATEHLYGQLSRTFRFDVLVNNCYRRIRLGIISYDIHLLVTKTKSDDSFCA